MSSIVSFIGTTSSRTLVAEALQRVANPSYDCAGLASLCKENNQILYTRSLKSLHEALQLSKQHDIDGPVTIGHLCSANHGQVTLENTHLQFDCNKTIALVHNGIIENHDTLRAQLEKKEHVFLSSTDTEILPHILEDAFNSEKSLPNSLVEIAQCIQGAYSFVAISQKYPDTLALIRRKSPLYIARTTQGIMIASDTCAFGNISNKICLIPDESVAIISRKQCTFLDFKGHPLKPECRDVSPKNSQLDCKHKHFILKEIYEQKNCINRTVEFLQHISGRAWDHIGIPAEHIQMLENIHIIGSESSFNVASIANHFFKDICKVNSQSHDASKFIAHPLLSEEKALYIFISSSGENKKTLEALKLVKSMNMPTLALTHEASSSLVREADGFIFVQYGQNYSGTSIKPFTNNIAALYWLAHRISYETKLIDKKHLQKAYEDILIAAEVLENLIENHKTTIEKLLAPHYAQASSITIISDHPGQPLAQETAQSLAKITYIPVRCYLADQLNDGFYTKIGDSSIVIITTSEASYYKKLLTTAQRFVKNGNNVVMFTQSKQLELQQSHNTTFTISETQPLLIPLAMSGLLQFFVYHIATQLKCSLEADHKISLKKSKISG